MYAQNLEERKCPDDPQFAHLYSSAAHSADRVAVLREAELSCGGGRIVLSGITDIADGIIARKFNMVSDLGKILDPVADKLTQAAMMLCLLSRYEWMLWLFLFFAVKELSTGISGLLVIRKKDVVNSAKWFGKLSTVVLDVVMFLLFLFPNIGTAWAKGMIALCAAVMLLSLVKYLLLHARLLREQDAAS